MQILLFVMTMLLLLSAITYAKMDNYRTMVLFRNRFEAYSLARNNKLEHDFYHSLYEKEKMTSKGSQGEGNKAEGTAYISLNPLQTGKDSEFTKQILKELITHLYEKQTFYQDLIKVRPNLAGDIVEAMTKGIKERDKSFKKVEELANIDLNDPILSEGYYKMLKGFTLPSKDNDSQEGYPSLTCYLSLNGSSKIRVYLAPRAILELLFTDPGTVTEVMTMRKKIYNDLKADRIKDEEANALFADSFANSLNAHIPPDKVDFATSKTDPNRKCVRFVSE